MFVFARESPLVSIQSDYVNIYQKRLKQLLENMLAGESEDRELIREIRSRIEKDDPRQYSWTQLFDCLEGRSALPGAQLLDVDAQILPGVDSQLNVFSVRTLQRRLARWDAIEFVALDFHDGFELQRLVQTTGFNLYLASSWN